MDIERKKKLLRSGIEAGNKVKAAREVIKTYKTQKQDMYDDTTEILKPSIEVQKEVKKTIDDKQNKVIEQLRSNQPAITRGMKDIKDATQDVFTLRNELPFPFAIEGPEEKQQEETILDVEPKEKQPYHSNLDQGFTPDEIQKLIKYNHFSTPFTNIDSTP